MFGCPSDNIYGLPTFTIGSFSEVKGGKRLPKGTQYSDEPTDHPYIRVVDMIDHSVKMDDLQYLDDETQKSISRYIINKNDVYISIAGTIGQVGMIPECLDGANLTENAAKIVLKNNAPVLPEYLVWYLSLPAGKQQIEDKTMNTTQPKLALFRIEEIEVLAPEFSQQQLFIDFVQQSDKSKFVRFKSQFIEQFGTWQNTKYDVKTLEELCEPIKDGTHKTPTYTDDKENGFLFLSSKDVTSRYVDWDHPMYIPADLHKELSKRISPKIGDILLAKNGTTGIAAIVDRDVVFDIYVSLALLRFHPGNNIKFMWSAINMPETKAQFDGNLKGIGVPNLHLGEIKKTKMVVPPLELQDEFAKFIEQSDKSK